MTSRPTKSKAGSSSAAAQEQLRSIATWIRLSDELAEDAGGLTAWLENFLAFLVKCGEEIEILTGPRGYLTRADIPAYAGSATDWRRCWPRCTARCVVDSGGIEPDTYVLHPSDWLTLVNEVASRRWQGIDDERLRGHPNAGADDRPGAGRRVQFVFGAAAERTGRRRRDAESQ